MTLIDYDAVSVSYGDFVALQDISLKIDTGEKIALIGPSGAGKSTLLRKIHATLDKEATFIHQDFALVKQLSSYLNVYMGRLNDFSIFKNIRNFFIPDKTESKKVRDILRKLALEEKFNEKTAALSGGQQQRVAIARAFYSKAEVLLGDEPVASQDPENSSNIMTTIMSGKETIVLSLHNVDLALKHANRIIGLKDGRIYFDTAPEKISAEQLRLLYKK